MENEKKVYFTSEVKIDWDTHKELNFMKYKIMNGLLLVWLLFSAVLSAYLFFVKYLTLFNCIMLFSVALFMAIAGVNLKKQPEIMQGRQKVRLGKDVVEQRIEFSDKINIYLTVDYGRSYDYALVERVFETKNNYYLMLPYGLAIVVNKGTLTGIEGIDFKQFIFDKCYSIKKSKLKKLKDGQKTLNRLLAIAFLLSVVVLMLFFFQQTPENWRKLGRNPKYSSSQQATSDNTSVSSSAPEITTESSK